MYGLRARQVAATFEGEWLRLRRCRVLSREVERLHTSRMGALIGTYGTLLPFSAHLCGWGDWCAYAPSQRTRSCKSNHARDISGTRVYRIHANETDLSPKFVQYTCISLPARADSPYMHPESKLATKACPCAPTGRHRSFLRSGDARTGAFNCTGRCYHGGLAK